MIYKGNQSTDLISAEQNGEALDVRNALSIFEDYFDVSTFTKIDQYWFDLKFNISNSQRQFLKIQKLRQVLVSF